jgi:two-component system chemotaxis sensor kinase CheA
VIRLRGKRLPPVDLAGVLGVDRSFVHPEDGRRYPERRQTVADRRSKNHSAPKTDYDGDDRRLEQDRRYHAESALNIAVVSTGKDKYGLVVDALNDAEEIVVKPLGKHLKGCHGFAGATIMGDGKVALILDVARIGEMSGLTSQRHQDRSGPVSGSVSAQATKSAGSQAYLFFSNSETERFAVPLDTVERIEKIEAARIETVGGNRVLKHRGGTLPLIALEDAMRVNPLPVNSNYQMICFKINGREIGVLATAPIDAAEVEITLDTKTLKQPGVIGSAVLMDNTTLILDIQQVVKQVKPDFFSEVQGDG